MNPAQEAAAREVRLLQHTGEALGASKVLMRSLVTQLKIHSALTDGRFQYASLIRFVSRLQTLDKADAVMVLGISLRTLERGRDTPSKPLSPHLASKLWCFAETLVQATEVFGGQAQAETWLNQPAVGLDCQRPIEMLRTIQGADLVNDILIRLEYNVYC